VGHLHDDTLAAEERQQAVGGVAPCNASLPPNSVPQLPDYQSYREEKPVREQLIGDDEAADNICLPVAVNVRFFQAYSLSMLRANVEQDKGDYHEGRYRASRAQPTLEGIRPLRQVRNCQEPTREPIAGE